MEALGSRALHRWRRNARLQSGFDPFQVFEVEHEACLHLEIKIHRGESITKGSAIHDMIDTPDPYVILRIPGCSNPSKRTSHIDNCINPIWDESFHFYLEPTKEHILKVILMDANYTMDETLGEDSFCINELTNDVPRDHTFAFPGGSKIHTTLMLERNKNPDLRFSLALCQKEKDFLITRRKKILVSMQDVLGLNAPDIAEQVPIIGVLGSGGGFRAMICLSAAVRALQEMGFLDCATYIAGLSGSSWYISTFYAHDTFPKVTHDQIQAELKESVTKDWKRHLFYAPKYVASMIAKYKQGQPVSFTDFFGHLLGDVLLKGQKHKKLTDTQRILVQGVMPMPLFTCLHAKRKVSCRSFSEWVEFSPYEIGIAKYGTFMKAEDFGNKFIVGKKIKHFDELPLHFLQGVWGSAFTILFKRLVMERGKKDIVQIMRDAQNEENIEDDIDDIHSSGESSDTEDEEDIEGQDDKESEEEGEDTKSQPHKLQTMNNTIPEDEEPTQDFTQISVDNVSTQNPPFNSSFTEKKEKLTAKSFDSLSLDTTMQKPNMYPEGTEEPKNKPRKISASGFNFDIPKRKTSKDNRKFSTESDPGVKTEFQSAQESRLRRQGAIKGSRLTRQRTVQASPGQKAWAERRKSFRQSRVAKKAGLWESLKESLMTGTNILNTRTGRAGEVLNPFRGLSLRHSFPISPFAADAMSLDEDQEDSVDSDLEFGASCRYRPLDNTAKKLFIVDSGLAFNSPYPLLLRPQRAVDLYLSFDFSQRPTDNTHPFKELLLAEKWAIQNKVPFPPIQKLVEEYEKDKEIKECYVFRHPSDHFCPVILHFCLVNNKFRKFKAPGVPRETEEEISFADFPIFDDPNNPFSSMNFVYEPLQFDRLTKLVEFNTYLCADTIKEEIEKIVIRNKADLREIAFRDIVKTVTRVSSLRRGCKGNNLRLKVSEKCELNLQDFIAPSIPINHDSNSDNSDSEYSDALEDLPSS